MAESQYLVIIEKAQNNYAAYVPDLPGCVTTGATLEEVKKNIHEAIEFHIDGLRRQGEPVPAPVTLGEYVIAS